MADNNLHSAIIELIPEMVLCKIPDVPDYKVSKKFERNMRRIIQSVDNKQVYRTRNISVRRIVAIVIAAILAVTAILTISVTAIREAFINFFMDVFDTHTVVQSVINDNPPETIEDIYIITYPLDDYEIVSQTDVNEYSSRITTKYENNENRIRFSQYAKKSYEINVNTEGYTLNMISINGNEGFVIDMDSYIFISWDNGDYIFTLDGNISENILISIANSVQKVEK